MADERVLEYEVGEARIHLDEGKNDGQQGHDSHA